ncbi:MAG: sulfurtransferase [Xanthomonadales bacterium]|nr:sulfurtransferase [Xanthomonadales bacterium]
MNTRESPLISVSELRDLIADGSVLVFDCRFDLFHPDRGHNSWLAAHIPGAVYAHLDDQLAGRVTRSSGRHPLPATRSFAAFLARSGWTKDKTVVAYDGHGGVFAARLWWLMEYFGLPGARILDGGIAAWMAASLPLESGEVGTARVDTPQLTPRPAMIASSNEIAARLEDDDLVLVDARAARRFEGLEEPIDPVAGHVPGALNHPTDKNLDEQSRFRSPGELKQQFQKLVGKQPSTDIVHMCGSGVTACHNLLAMELAGITGSRIYAGSWSEWIRNPSRPVVRGASSG